MGDSGHRLGFYGGSFNPPTLAHKALAEFILSEAGLSRLHWIVSPHNPDKPPEMLAPFEHRLKMAQTALSSYSNMIADDIEHHLGSSYTLNTVKELRRRHPDEALFFILGMDNWHGFHTWDREDDRILDYVSLIIMRRPGYDGLENAASTRVFADKQVADVTGLAPSGTWTVIDNPMMDVAATNIRKALEQGQTPENVQPEILDYIYENGLYRPKTPIQSS